jgi:hypothetical protein
VRALSVRQPFAELILRGIKTVEYRTIPTRIVGERFFIYAPRKLAAGNLAVWSRDLGMPDGRVPDWMIELAKQVGMIEPEALLPTGVIVGSAVIERCEEIRDQKSEISGRASGLTSDLRPLTSIFRWHLTDVERAQTLRKPRNHPQPVWFNPF